MFFAWSLAVGGGRVSAAPEAQVPVLILISRSPSDTWSVAELDGMKRTLAAARPPVASIAEYMDFQNPAPDGYDAELVNYYRTKFAQQKFRVVLGADEPALDFLIRHRDTLFPEAQVVFCGVSKFDPALRTDRPWLTGMLESNDPAASYRLALSLQPGLKRIVILDDRTLTGQSTKKRIEQDEPEATERVPLEIVRADTAHALFTVVENLAPDTAVLLTRSQITRRMGPELLAQCPVPIYGQRSPTHVGAMLGGVVIDGERHGEAAARMGLRLLAGESAADLPTVIDSPKTVMVDYAQMRRFGLPFAALPPGAEILNRPRHVWEVYPDATRIAVIALTFLVILAGCLAWALAQKRRGAAALKSSLSLLHATLDASADGVLVVDSKGRVSGFNRRFGELWGIPQALVDRRDDAELLAFAIDQLKDPAAFLRRVQELYATPAAESSEVIEFRDGRVFDRRSRPQQLDGKIVGRVWTFTDITARSQAEQARLALEAKLSHTHRLEALGTLAGGIAHDFNNLLTAIMGYTHLAHSSLGEEHPVRPDLEAVLTASERARNLVQQILTFSRKSPFERRPVQLAPVVRDAVHLLRATTPAAVEIHCEVDGNDDVVLADSSQVHQAILNLGTNAVHAMHGAPGTITVQLDTVEVAPQFGDDHPQLGKRSCLCVTVRDTGQGMDAETLRRVFDPFFTTKAPGEGTGLGLAVVHGIMQNHEGAVTLESKVGEGTTARLFFPLVEAPVEDEPTPPVSAVGRHAGRVLLVDDELPVLRVAEQLLQRLGYEVTACCGPAAALEILRQDTTFFDVVLTDLNMPQMTGTDVAAEIRRIAPEIGIVLATGYLGDGAVEERAAEIGIEEIVAKPYTPAALGGAVQHAIAKALARRDGELAHAPS
uniref:histidine kinase n=1 Tax=uncultured Verrucomicrobiota bacterium TaxID=156588 RepID=D2DXR8_9BACT|nr:putative PAS/PAC sensor protein [uncultured Verrucomicrobiota bacterium]